MSKAEEDAIKVAQAVKAYKDLLPGLLEMQELNAQLMYKKFSSLVKAGFNVDQALILCRDVSPTSM